MKIAFTSHRWAHHSGWVGDRKTLTRINRLITAAARDPVPAQASLRRADQLLVPAHRPGTPPRLYTVEADQRVIVEARYHC